MVGNVKNNGPQLILPVLSNAVPVAYQHGLRAAELLGLRWDSVDFNHGLLHVNRVKDGSPATHQLISPTLRALRRLQREQNPKSPFIFTSERGAAGWRKMLARLGVVAGFGFVVHPHMLRHGCGYKLANDGVDTRTIAAYLGHRNIQNTMRYTELSPTRFKGLWDDWN
jgi:type 1 fimbriae regulatory protein FimB/type 1 fimbriae regulatory protein FimE